MVHTSTLLFKNNPTLACTSDNFAPVGDWAQTTLRRCRWVHHPSLKALLAPSHNILLLSKLILAPALCLYLATAFFTAFMCRRQDTKAVISSAYTDTFVKRGPAKGMPRKAGLACSSLSLQSKSSKART